MDPLKDINREAVRKKRRRRRRRYNYARIFLTLLIMIALLAALVALVYFVFFRDDPNRLPVDVKTTGVEDNTTAGTTETEETTAAESAYQEILDRAGVIAAMYDYDGAIAYVEETVPDYAEHEELTNFITSCKAMKTKLIKWADNTKITHVFFHSLIVDEDKAFGSYKRDDYNEVMTTVDEFRQIIQNMYDKGFVLVRLSDIAKIETQPDGTQQMVMQEIYLPAGKTPFVLSEDDVCYYDYMTGTGFANRIVIGDDGRPTCEMDLEDGTKVRGEFDVLPIIDAFIDEHPDFSYHGAKGILALTGYNGILGYRTSYITYGVGDTTWPSAHEYDNPNIEADRAAAAAVAQAIRADGWEFASHTWGHMRMSSEWAGENVPSPRFYRDTDWWESEVESLIGDTDIIIFAFGADIGSWRGYADDNAMYVYLKQKGFNYFCNVDSSVHAWVQMSKTAGGSGYLRQGRRNLDGQLMLKAILYPEKEILTDLFDPKEVFSRKRPLPVGGVTVPEGTDLTKIFD